MKLKVIYFFETYAPVVQWTIVCLMLILEVILKLRPKKGDITAEFIHSKLEENEEYLSICRNNLISMKNVENEGY